eukprot:6491280-Amphidinium_carterae.2
MERGSTVGTAGVKLATSSEDVEYVGDESHRIYRSVCGRLQFASPRRPDLLFTLKELGRGLAKPTNGHFKLMKHLMRYIRGPDKALRGVHTTQSTIATSSADGTCACASEAVYVKELLKFIGEETHIQLELDASSAVSMGSRVGLGKARHVAISVATATSSRQDHQASEGEGTQHPPDVGTKHLNKQGMLHTKSMLGLMEPESL